MFNKESNVVNLDNPVGELAWNGEKVKNFGSVRADWKVGVREFMRGRRKREERENKWEIGLEGRGLSNKIELRSVYRRRKENCQHKEHDTRLCLSLSLSVICGSVV